MARASSTADILFFIVRHLLTVSMRVAFLLFLIIHHSRPKCHWQVCPEMTRLYGQYGTRGRKAARGRLRRMRSALNGLRAAAPLPFHRRAWRGAVRAWNWAGLLAPCPLRSQRAAGFAAWESGRKRFCSIDRLGVRYAPSRCLYSLGRCNRGFPGSFRFRLHAHCLQAP